MRWRIMSKKIFTEKEIKLLSANSYVTSLSSKGITYTDELNIYLLRKKRKASSREIYEECGFDVAVSGIHRVHSASKRWKRTTRTG
jgi:transposase